MPQYLLQIAYTPEAWAALLKNPQNRIDAVRPNVEKLGGKVVGAWFAFGKYDLVTVFDLPDNVSVAAISMAFAAGGALKAVKTTPLMSMEEGIEAMRKAPSAGYKPVTS